MATGPSGGQPSVLSTLPKDLPLDFLKTITEQFSPERILGTGTFGTVYMGIAPDGQKITVKKLAENSPIPRDKLFTNEVLNIMALHHENVVKLVGYCHEAQKKVVQNNGRYIVADIVESLLCYEYLPKGNLQKNLFEVYNDNMSNDKGQPAKSTNTPNHDRKTTTSTPMTSLRFGSFHIQSAPSRICNVMHSREDIRSSPHVTLADIQMLSRDGLDSPQREKESTGLHAEIFEMEVGSTPAGGQPITSATGADAGSHDRFFVKTAREVYPAAGMDSQEGHNRHAVGGPTSASPVAGTAGQEGCAGLTAGGSSAPAAGMVSQEGYTGPTAAEAASPAAGAMLASYERSATKTPPPTFTVNVGDEAHLARTRRDVHHHHMLRRWMLNSM